MGTTESYGLTDCVLVAMIVAVVAYGVWSMVRHEEGDE